MHNSGVPFSPSINHPCTVLRLLLFLVSAGLLAACASVNPMANPDRRAYVRENGLTGKDSAHVMEGRIYRGMLAEYALAALGTPNERDTTSTENGPRVRYVYRARANAFDPGNLARAYVYAEAGRVTGWKNLTRIPRFDAYYEGGM